MFRVLGSGFGVLGFAATWVVQHFLHVLWLHPLVLWLGVSVWDLGLGLGFGLRVWVSG